MKESEIELLGLEATIKEAKNKTLIGINGKIVEETRNLIVIETEKGKKKAIKSQILLEILVNGKKREIKGERLVGRSDERIK